MSFLLPIVPEIIHVNYHGHVKPWLAGCQCLNKYEFLRSIDKIRCAVNYVIKGQLQDAKKLLKKSFSANIFWGAMRSVRKPKFLAYWIFGAIFLSLIYRGLGKHLGKSFHWLLYDQWKRRFA